ncbi:phage holin [Canibacter zhoujuaniae]|uniref:phage holin n=1 Tax=Canibacter zhoujuaniae TaxID=2708343 RepID=UPI00141EE361|nr:hypothetical protein [Canibacter zhoujuaniae]
MTYKRRQLIYRLSIALTALLVIYGVLTEEQAAAWIGLVAVGLGVPGLALSNMSPDDDDTQRLKSSARDS